MPTKNDLPSSPRLKCFVAMAFERTDTDAIYDRAIEPCLSKLSINPIRVDRIEHNDDMDDKILEELEGCAFAVVDLTYARPSVYFEAGYAQREVPVIFTARKDYFRPKLNDAGGTSLKAAETSWVAYRLRRLQRVGRSSFRATLFRVF